MLTDAPRPSLVAPWLTLVGVISHAGDTSEHPNGALEGNIMFQQFTGDHIAPRGAAPPTIHTAGAVCHALSVGKITGIIGQVSGNLRGLAAHMGGPTLFNWSPWGHRVPSGIVPALGPLPGYTAATAVPPMQSARVQSSCTQLWPPDPMPRVLDILGFLFVLGVTQWSQQGVGEVSSNIFFVTATSLVTTHDSCHG